MLLISCLKGKETIFGVNFRALTDIETAAIGGGATEQIKEAAAS